MRKFFAVVATASFFIAGCSSGLSRKAAEEAIDKSFLLAKAALLINYGRIGDKCADEAAHVLNVNPATDFSYVAAQNAGLISVTPDGPDYWKVEVLDVKPAVLEIMKRNPHHVANGCDYQFFDIPVAKKSVVEVTRITQITDATAEAEFKWKWELTPQGEKLVNRLSSSQMAELDWRLFSRDYSPESKFTLTNLSQSLAPHDGKATLKKSGESWMVAK